MTINQQIDSIFKHPFFQLAMKRYQEGDPADLRQLFFEMHFHVYEKTTLNASRTYGTYRWLDTTEIIAEVRATPPPDNLDIRLPIPPRSAFKNKPDITVTFEKKKAAVKIRHIEIPNQLNLFQLQTA